MIDIDIDTGTREMRSHGWLRRPELDELKLKRGENMLSEVWELPDGRWYKRLWIVTSPNKPEYIGSIKQVKNRMGTKAKSKFD